MVLGAFHFVLRKRFLALSFDHDSPDGDNWGAVLWDLAFYMLVRGGDRQRVQTAGVLLVFSFLIVPAVFSALFTQRLGLRLVMAWALGALVSAAGLFGSFRFDLPTGATVVVTFGVALLLGGVARGVLTRMTRAKAPELNRAAAPPA